MTSCCYSVNYIGSQMTPLRLTVSSHYYLHCMGAEIVAGVTDPTQGPIGIPTNMDPFRETIKFITCIGSILTGTASRPCLPVNTVCNSYWSIYLLQQIANA